MKKLCKYCGSEVPRVTKGGRIYYGKQWEGMEYCSKRCGPKDKPRQPLRERFMGKVDTSGDCWEWTGGKNYQGYGHFQLGFKNTVRAHRLAYELFVGEIPNGLHLDHLCRNTSCVNPDHLEAVTRKVNMERGAHAMKTHCPRGHEYNKKNTYNKPTGGRACRICTRVATDKYQARKKLEKINNLKVLNK